MQPIFKAPRAAGALGKGRRTWHIELVESDKIETDRLQHNKIFDYVKRLEKYR